MGNTAPGTDPRETRLRRMRIDAGVGQAELARRMGIGRSHVCRVERGDARPWPRFRRAAAEALGIREDVLFGDRLL